MADKTIRRCAVVGALTACFAGRAPACALGAGQSSQKANRILIVSIAGMHEFDLERFVAAHPTSTLAALKKRGISTARAMAPRPSDSFSGMIAMATGALPKRSGVFYDNSRDRALTPAGTDRVTKGAAAPLNSAIDVDQEKVDTAIDEAKLQRDPAARCNPVWPHQYLPVNTIVDVVMAAGGRTTVSSAVETRSLASTVLGL